MAQNLSQLWTLVPLRSAVLLMEAASVLVRQATGRSRHSPVSRHERSTHLKMTTMLKWLALRVIGRLAGGRKK